MMMAVLRMQAIALHRWYNLMYEGGDPVMWQWHMNMIRAFYGW